jgi:hypothetical protein
MTGKNEIAGGIIGGMIALIIGLRMQNRTSDRGEGRYVLILGVFVGVACGMEIGRWFDPT